MQICSFGYAQGDDNLLRLRPCFGGTVLTSITDPVVRYFNTRIYCGADFAYPVAGPARFAVPTSSVIGSLSFRSSITYSRNIRAS
jgi:hypothetical protein